MTSPGGTFSHTFGVGITFLTSKCVSLGQIKASASSQKIRDTPIPYGALPLTSTLAIPRNHSVLFVFVNVKVLGRKSAHGTLPGVQRITFYYLR